MSIPLIVAIVGGIVWCICGYSQKCPELGELGRWSFIIAGAGWIYSLVK